MSFKTLTYQSIALAGVAQSVYLVHQLATAGKADTEAFKTSIASLLIFDVDNPVDIYGGLAGVKTGLQQLQKQLSTNHLTNPDQARYAASLVFLESKFSEYPDMQTKVHNKLEVAHGQSEHFGATHENVLANMADIYHTTVSTLAPRIMVNGDPSYLSSPEIINKIRSLLLAGIRSTMLWKQCGGSRWRFLFFRQKMLIEVEFLLAELEKQEAN
jgi:high frequency lysogenization protein